MNDQNPIRALRLLKGLSQDEVAEKVYVTRQAVSRWENGETTPNTETLMLLSKLFDVSINTLLGSPRKMICHCCGMELDAATTSREADGGFNENYCKWCYHEGEFTLDFWQRYRELGGDEGFERFQQQLMAEFNALGVDGMPEVTGLNVLTGSYINLAYPLPSGEKVKFLNDNATYLGNQLHCLYGGSRCFGVVANMQFLLVCTYGPLGEDPELVVYKRR